MRKEQKDITEGSVTPVGFIKNLNITESLVRFNVNSNKVSFIIIHNLDDNYFNIALDGWLTITNKYNSNSLTNYIKSKNTGHVVMTEKEFNKTI